MQGLVVNQTIYIYGLSNCSQNVASMYGYIWSGPITFFVLTFEIFWYTRSSVITRLGFASLTLLGKSGKSWRPSLMKTDLKKQARALADSSFVVVVHLSGSLVDQ